MTSPFRLVIIASLLFGCATGSGGAELPLDEDVGEFVESDKPIDPLVDASLFPFLDHAVVGDAGSTFVGSRDVSAVDVGSVGCSAPREACGGGCVDTSINPAHCGGCNQPCALGQTCAAGLCQSACALPQTMCGTSCVNRSTDAANCGACGTRCNSAQSCVAGVCRSTITCSAPQSLCGTVCVDRSTDATNCGACGIRCTTTQTCNAGICSSATSSAGTVGQACTARSAVCGAGVCRDDWPGGYCTDLCVDDSYCETGSICIYDRFADVSFCVRSCTSVAQCRTGYRCYALPSLNRVCVL